MALGQVYLLELWFYLSVTLRQYATLSFTYMLILQNDKGAKLFRKSGNTVQKITVTLVFKMTIIIIIAVFLALGSFSISYDCT
jgi:hypothetical protein